MTKCMNYFTQVTSLWSKERSFCRQSNQDRDVKLFAEITPLGRGRTEYKTQGF